MSLSLINTTVYDTKQLKSWIRLCIQHEDSTKSRRWRVTVYQSKMSCIHGRAFVSSGTWRIGLPKTTGGLTPEQLKTATQVAIHEIGHCLGLQHRDMAKWRQIDVSWLPSDLRIQPKAAAKTPDSPSPQVQAEARIASLQKKIAHHERCIRSLQTRISTWRRRAAQRARRAQAALPSGPAAPVLSELLRGL